MMDQIWLLHPTAARILLQVTVAEDVLTQLMRLSGNVVGRGRKAAGSV